MSEKNDETEEVSDEQLDSALKKLLDTLPMSLKSIKKKRPKKAQPPNDE